ncbi:hypothetical protein SKAU_G00430200, partial [Synaphobranchus kaupii]
FDLLPWLIVTVTQSRGPPVTYALCTTKTVRDKPSTLSQECCRSGPVSSWNSPTFPRLDRPGDLGRSRPPIAASVIRQSDARRHYPASPLAVSVWEKAGFFKRVLWGVWPLPALQVLRSYFLPDANLPNLKVPDWTIAPGRFGSGCRARRTAAITRAVHSDAAVQRGCRKMRRGSRIPIEADAFCVAAVRNSKKQPPPLPLPPPAVAEQSS